jgi:ABC-type nitrate/sulfonate/bicarbonate transport system ATPase subunit/predicted N-acetyltransferase YhbS
VLDVRDVTVDFGGPPILADASLHVADGEVVALLGPSGSGKSTLLRVIAGLTVPRAGTITLDGADITRQPTHRRGIGMVFQDDQLFPHRDVAANVAFGLRMRHVPMAQRAARVAAMFDLVGLAGFGSRQVTDLSGGEAKRVALARSLAPAPRALLLDEPLTGLDRELHDRLAVELGRILRATGTTALIVTHDRDEAAVVADRIVTTGELQGADAGGRRVIELTAEATHGLRRRVLRAGTPSTDVVFADDDSPTTVHLGLVDEQGTLIAISSWAWRPFPADASGRRAVQLRGMAVDPAHQRTGAGAILLGAGVERARADGAELVWANARDSALGFYTAHGFETVGAGYLDATTAIPHHRIRRLVR